MSTFYYWFTHPMCGLSSPTPNYSCSRTWYVSSKKITTSSFHCRKIPFFVWLILGPHLVVLVVPLPQCSRDYVV